MPTERRRRATAATAATTATRENAAGPETDGRLLRGARTRHTIARHGVDVASAESLSGLSIGRLATDLGMSKSGVATLFGSKEQLQLAVVAAAREAYLDAVVRPATAGPPGVARLHALLDGWFAYAEQPLFPGGCFWAATIPDFDSRPGPVRDALRAQRREWLALLAEHLRHAVDSAEIPELAYESTAFHIDALLVATNTALRLGDPEAPTRTRDIINTLLAPRS